MKDLCKQGLPGSFAYSWQLRVSWLPRGSHFYCHSCHHWCPPLWSLHYILQVPLRSISDSTEQTENRRWPHSLRVLAPAPNYLYCWIIEKRRIIHSADLGSQPVTQIISEWIIHMWDNWELPKLLLEAQTSHGRTLKMGSMNTRIGQRPLLGSGVLYSHDKLLPFNGMMVTVGQHWYQNSHVLCPGLCVHSLHHSAHNAIRSLWCILFSPILSYGGQDQAVEIVHLGGHHTELSIQSPSLIQDNSSPTHHFVKRSFQHLRLGETEIGLLWYNAI